MDKLDFLAPLQKRAFEAICQKLDTLIEGSNEEIKNSFRLWAQKEKVKAHIESLRLLKNIEDNFATFPEFFETRTVAISPVAYCKVKTFALCFEYFSIILSGVLLELIKDENKSVIWMGSLSL